MSQAISSLQSTDPTLASKLTDLQKQVDTMKKNGSSEKDIQSTIKSTMDGLSDTEKSEMKSAMPTPPSGGPGGPGGPPPAGGHHHKKASSSDSDSSSGDSSDTTSFSASSLLDASSSMQNDSIMSMLSSRSSASAL